jgi:hypothetical protein
MYGFGVSAAALIDVKVFTKYLRFWANPKHEQKVQADLDMKGGKENEV